MKDSEIQDLGRRSFLCAAPLAAGMALADSKLFAAQAEGQTEGQGGVWFVPHAYQMFTAASIADDCKALEGKSATTNLVQNKNFTIVITSETAKTAPEYEWHAGRDHIFHILEGETVYEVGGTPLKPRSVGTGEWLSTTAKDYASIHLKKGDMLVLPRGTLHRRITVDSVTLMLIAPMGTKA